MREVVPGLLNKPAFGVPAEHLGQVGGHLRGNPALPVHEFCVHPMLIEIINIQRAQESKQSGWVRSHCTVSVTGPVAVVAPEVPVTVMV